MWDPNAWKGVFAYPCRVVEACRRTKAPRIRRSVTPIGIG
jgi:hypothetical protein